MDPTRLLHAPYPIALDSQTACERVRRPFARLLVGLQAVPGGGQQLGHQLATDAVAHGL
jgi:hypothetical protein